MSKKETSMKTRILPIRITDNDTGTVYELDFCRDSIRFAEAREFDFVNGPRLPQKYTEDLFYYAFRMHHKNVAREYTDKLIARLGGPLSDAVTPVTTRLTELYAQALSGNNLTEEETAKNAQVTVDM